MSTLLSRVGDLAEQVRGVTYGKDDASTTQQPGYLPVLRAGNITDDGLVFSDLVFVPAQRISAKQKIRRHDVIVAASSGSLEVVGKTAPALTDFEGGFGAFCKVLRPNAKVHPNYFAQFFKTQDYRRRVSALAAGANINNLRNEHLDEMQIPLPPMPEQRRIAEVLDQAETLRAKRRAALSQLDALTQSIFLDMFGDPASNPKGWPVRAIRDLLESASYGTSEKSSATGEFPVLRMNNISRTGQMDFTDLKFMDLPSSQYDRYLVRTGDVLFNRTNSVDLVGKTGVYRETKPVAYAGYLIRLRVNKESDPEFLSAYLNSAYSKKMLRGMCKSIIGMANINATEIQAMRTPHPPVELQREFARRIAAVEKLKATQRAALAELDALFAVLQHRAFRGEL